MLFILFIGIAVRMGIIPSDLIGNFFFILAVNNDIIRFDVLVAPIVWGNEMVDAVMDGQVHVKKCFAYN